MAESAREPVAKPDGRRGFDAQNAGGELARLPNDRLTLPLEVRVLEQERAARLRRPLDRGCESFAWSGDVWDSRREIGRSRGERFGVGDSLLPFQDGARKRKRRLAGTSRRIGEPFFGLFASAHRCEARLLPLRTLDLLVRCANGCLGVETFGVIFRAIRVPSRGIVLFDLALGVLAAWGLSRLARGRRSIVAAALVLVAFEYRAVDHDPAATSEWEQLDGDQVPMLRMGNHSILRGFDQIKLQQLFGWVGC